MRGITDQELGEAAGLHVWQANSTLRGQEIDQAALDAYACASREMAVDKQQFLHGFNLGHMKGYFKDMSKPVGAKLASTMRRSSYFPNIEEWRPK